MQYSIDIILDRCTALLCSAAYHADELVSSLPGCCLFNCWSTTSCDAEACGVLSCTGVGSAMLLCLILTCVMHACVQILLVTEQGLVLEGTQTNFFAVVDDTVYTAEEGVLMGTVRGVVLEVGFKCTFCHVCTKTHLYSSFSFCIETGHDRALTTEKSRTGTTSFVSKHKQIHTILDIN